MTGLPEFRFIICVLIESKGETHLMKDPDMMQTTRNAITAILQADVSLSENERQEIQARLCGHDEEDRVMTRKEVAALLGNKSLRYVDYLAAEGVIKKVTMPGRTRAIGYSSASVYAAMRRP